MPMEMISDIIKRHLAENEDVVNSVLAEYDAHNLRLFGSVAENTATENSDVDVLVDIANPPNGRLFARAGLSEKLSEILGRRVDIVFSDDAFAKKLTVQRP
jgi:predicted nucleotidyltransferase